VLIGNGHACPPDVSPLPDCCPWRSSYPDRLIRTERRVLETLNGQLMAQSEPPLDRVGQLFARATANWIATFRELDHYPERPAGNHEYVGAWSELPAQKPIWPNREGPRVFAYLKTAATAAPVLAELDRRGLPTVAFVPGADHMNLPSYSDSVRVSGEPLDIEPAARECDVAILHSGHSVARFLLAGKPILALPLTGEQHLMAANVARIGAGEWLHPERLELLPQYIERILTDGRYRAAAAEFAQRYAECTPARQLQQVIDRLIHIAGC
jgi:UDP:flavonoid glycosyltransferase YjiC (YdhE family)